MFILSLSSAQIAGATWANAARTLTADPATDAGAATLVWARVARTLTVDPATDAGAATLIWQHLARTVTTAVNNYTALGNSNFSLGAGAILDLRPGAGNFREVTSTAILQGNFKCGIYDGVNFACGNTALATFLCHGCLTSANGLCVQNTSGGALAMGYAGWNIG